MKSAKLFLMLGLFLFAWEEESKAQQSATSMKSLDKKHQAIVTISAFTATGKLDQLEKALNDGLNAGLKINEIKEVLVQLYAYAGFPRSLNALSTFNSVLKIRKGKGIADGEGKNPTPIPGDINKLQFGTDMQTKLVGSPVKGEIYEFAPAIDQFLKEHLFGDIFGRDNLDWKTRELATISALSVLGGVDNQLRSHFGVGMYNGLTEQELRHAISIIQSGVDKNAGNNAGKILMQVLKARASNDQHSSIAIRDLTAEKTLQNITP